MNLESLMPNEKEKVTKVMYCVIKSMQNIQNGQIHRNLRWLRGWQGRQGWAGDCVSAQGFGDEENALELNGSDGSFINTLMNPLCHTLRR